MLVEMQTILAEWGIGGDQLAFGLAFDMFIAGLFLNRKKEASDV